MDRKLTPSSPGGDGGRRGRVGVEEVEDEVSTALRQEVEELGRCRAALADGLTDTEHQVRRSRRRERERRRWRGNQENAQMSELKNSKWASAVVADLSLLSVLLVTL